MSRRDHVEGNGILPPAKRTRSSLRSPQVLFGLFILVFFSVIAAAAPWIAPQDPVKMQPGKRNLQPAWLRADASIEGYWLGSDRFGRDVFGRLVYGARAAMFLALAAAPLAALLGTLVGVISGYAGGWAEMAIMRAADIFNAFPAILFSVLMVLVLRTQPLGQVLNGLLTLTIAFAAIAWVGLARILRSVVLQLKTRPFVEAAYALGGSHWHIIREHILPNLLSLIAVWVINAVPQVILLEAGLGYLGVDIISAPEGNEFQVTSWGGLFFEGRSLIHSNPLVLLAPTVCVFLISFSFSLLAGYLDRRFNKGQELKV